MSAIFVWKWLKRLIDYQNQLLVNFLSIEQSINRLIVAALLPNKCIRQMLLDSSHYRAVLHSQNYFTDKKNSLFPSFNVIIEIWGHQKNTTLDKHSEYHGGTVLQKCSGKDVQYVHIFGVSKTYSKGAMESNPTSIRGAHALQHELPERPTVCTHLLV